MLEKNECNTLMLSIHFKIGELVKQQQMVKKSPWKVSKRHTKMVQYLICRPFNRKLLKV